MPPTDSHEHEFVLLSGANKGWQRCGICGQMERAAPHSSALRSDAASHGVLPDCMIPDAADPCAAYQQLERELADVTAKLVDAQRTVYRLQGPPLKEPSSATSPTKYDPAANFDKCDNGWPCMCETTGCAKGQCSRRRPHAFTTSMYSRNKCVICGAAQGEGIHGSHPFVIEVPTEGRDA